MGEDSHSEASSPGPSSRLHSPAVDFVDNRLAGYHPAFDTRHVQFDPLQNQFMVRMPPTNQFLVPAAPPTLMVPSFHHPSQQAPRPAPGLINEMSFWNEVFPKAMQLLQEEPLPKGADDPIWGIRLCSTWVDVQAKLDMAQREYNFQNGPQQTGRFRRSLRNGLDKHTITMKQASKFVPDVDIARPIVGAIQVVLDAYQQASEVRNEVNKGFEDLPEVFESIDFYLRTYPKDQNIIRAACQLVRAIFKSIEYAVAFFTSNQARRAGVAIFSGAEYQKSLRNCLTEVTNYCDTLKHQAGMSQAHRITSDNQHMIHQNDTIMQDNQIMQSVLGAIRHQGQLNDLGIQYCVYSVNMMLSILRDQETAWRIPAPQTRSPSPLPQLIETQPLWFPQDIQNRLHIPHIDDVDLGHVAGNMLFLLHEDRGKTQQLLGDLVFRRWLGRRDSARLLVHGDYRDTQNISPLSVLCTILSYTFRSPGISNTIGLVFFCGLHQERDEFQGASAMIRSLIAQLMTQYSFAPIASCPGVDKGELISLCELFALLVQQLPPSMRIFCLIDGIKLYENEPFFDDMSTVILSLVDMVDQLVVGRGPTFKLLITSPIETAEVQRKFDSGPDVLVHMRNFPNAGNNMSVPSMQTHLTSEMDVGD